MTATMTGHAPIGADVLSHAEAIALADCEQRIERGMKTFIEVGMALAAIQQNRLYRAQFDTFEEYCADRWGFTGRRGRQLIEAAEIGTMVPIENEGQARALSAAPAAEREDVLREARERTDGKPTAKVISDVVKERAKPKDAGVGTIVPTQPDLTSAIERALTSAGPTGMTAWQLAFLIDPAGPDADRAELAVRMAPILEELAAQDRARVVGEVDGGLLWALAEPDAPAEPEREPLGIQTPEPVAAETPAPVAGSGSTSPEPEPERHLSVVPDPPRSALAVTPEQRQQIADDGERRQAIANAHKKADRLVREVSAVIGEIEAGIAYGEPGLVTAEMVAGLRAEADRLEQLLEAK
jgi:hypothetical protein